jgi:hypothetical protein
MPKLRLQGIPLTIGGGGLPLRVLHLPLQCGHLTLQVGRLPLQGVDLGTQAVSLLLIGIGFVPSRHRQDQGNGRGAAQCIDRPLVDPTRLMACGRSSGLGLLIIVSHARLPIA